MDTLARANTDVDFSSSKEMDMTSADMTTRTTDAASAGGWKEIAAALFRLGATSYGGPAIMGVMQAELQERRKWVSKERFLEGLSVANMVPGATATQLGIFLGYVRGGWWGGLLGGFCFVLPAFFVMLALTIAYAGLGVTPIARGALYGLGPVVLGLFAVAVYRLGRTAMSTVQEAAIGVVAATASIGTPLGIVAILVLAGSAGLLLFHSRKAASAHRRPRVGRLPRRALNVFVAGDFSSRLGCHRRNPKPEESPGCRRVLPQGRSVHDRRRPDDDRIHPRPGRRAVRLADPA
jgi:chromate transport protein ChrA